MYITRFTVLIIGYLGLMLNSQARNVVAICACVPGQCSSDQVDDGQCVNKKDTVFKARYFCCISSDNGIVDCDCRDDCKLDGNHILQGMCSSSLTVGRRCCWSLLDRKKCRVRNRAISTTAQSI